jgi:hypothetical protein
VDAVCAVLRGVEASDAASRDGPPAGRSNSWTHAGELLMCCERPHSVVNDEWFCFRTSDGFFDLAVEISRPMSSSSSSSINASLSCVLLGGPLAPLLLLDVPALGGGLLWTSELRFERVRVRVDSLDCCDGVESDLEDSLALGHGRAGGLDIAMLFSNHER